ncbi:unnamed protein product [Brassicogethes aeneus]|uniref:Kinesin motor domain-containing protein n=1 Tax=Brassicogethes aeneus TaxID=1431903 RepID=A0A9P0B3A5_BRAAE|nr:unnamed protein product [Brassicogethes aeneus]
MHRGKTAFSCVKVIKSSSVGDEGIPHNYRLPSKASFGVFLSDMIGNFRIGAVLTHGFCTYLILWKYSLKNSEQFHPFISDMTKDLCQRKNDSKVYYRIYPIHYIDNKYVKLDKDNINIFIRNRQDLAKNCSALQKDYIYWKFITDGVFRNISQGNIYNTIIEDVLDRVIEGNDAIILAFGQTGSGKSLTIGGLDGIRQNIGISPRLISDLFELKTKFKKNLKFNLEMSYMEFGSNNAFDLLKECPNTVDYPFTMSKIRVKEKIEAYTYLYKGEGRKDFILNNHRSHIYSSVLTFFITIKNLSLEKPHQFSSKIHVIDLAGTDSFGNESCGFKSIKAVGSANLIKSNLEAFILYLCDNLPEIIKVKYRMNPLIKYLGSSLSNETILRFIGHISLEPENILVSLSLLRFGQIVKGVKTKFKELVPELNKEVEVDYYKAEIQKLKDEKKLELILSNQLMKKSIDGERFSQMERCVKEYLENSCSAIDLLNVAEIKTTYEIFKDIYRDLVIKNEQSYKIAYRTALEDIAKNKNILEDITKNNKNSIDASTVKSKQSILPANGSQRPSNSSKATNSSKMIASSSKANNLNGSIKSARKESKMPVKSVESTIPNEIPDFNEVWDKYIKDETTNYNQYMEEYQSNEANLKDIYLIYKKQIELLQQLKENVVKREQEFEEIKLLNKTLQEVSDEEKNNLSDCLHNLNCAKEEYARQLDETLTCKTHLQVNLKMRSDLRKLLDEDFANYSKRLYDAMVPNLENFDPLANETVNLDDISEEPGECEAEVNKAISDALDAPFEKLKVLMKLEMKKKQLYLETHKSFNKSKKYH